jgi:flagellar hook-basal body complex protein FliE
VSEPEEARATGHGANKRAGASNNERANEPAAPVAPVARAEQEPSKSSEKPAPKKSAAGSSIDDLLNDAIGSKNNPGGSSKEASAAAANLPEKPTRDDVLSAMKSVSDAVKACGNGQSGVAFANVTVAGKTGKVSNVEVTGMTGDVGSCIARSVRKASFPKFKADNFQVKFPFRM